MDQKKKIAFIHRYGLEGWICCGGHAAPGIIEEKEGTTAENY